MCLYVCVSGARASIQRAVGVWRCISLVRRLLGLSLFKVFFVCAYGCERERERFLRSRLLYEDVYLWQGDCEDEVSWMSKLCVSMCNVCLCVRDESAIIV